VGEVTRYFLRRVLLVPPTLFCVIALNFAVVQLAPGGPAQTLMDQARHGSAPGAGVYRGAEGLDAAQLAALDRQFGFDRPALVRFGLMLRGYLTFQLGTSIFEGEPVAALIAQRLPVSLSLGAWSTLLVYLIAVPLGVAKAVRHGSRFDAATSFLVLGLYAVPGFLLAILLLGIFGAGGAWPVFPLGGLASPGAAGWGWSARVADYAWHMVLPTLALTAGGLATLTMLVKNSVLEEVQKLYVTAARAKGTGEARVLWRHVLPNALLLVIAGFPAAFTAILFTSALLVEIVFSLNGLGLLGYEAVLRRDDPVMFGTLYVYTLTGLVMQIVGDFLFTVLDPRIDFEPRA
jgi:microcin C transport system permease protein